MLTLAWRLARGGRTRLILLAACVAIGVAARAFVATITAQAEVAIATEARPLLGGDVEVAANGPINDDLRQRIAKHLPPGWTGTDTVGLVSMAGSDTATHLVEVRAIGPGFPLLPAVPLASTEAGVTTLAEAVRDRGVAVEATALPTFGIALGDTLRLGQERFTVRAIIGDDPSLTGSPFTLGPRLVMSLDDLASTGLGGFGSRTRHAWLIRLEDPLAGSATAAAVAKALDLDETEVGFGARGAGETGVQVRSAQQAQFGLRRVFDRLGDFLRLAALGSLIIAAVGVAALVAATVRARADEIAVLATLGCPPRRSARLLLVQILGATVLGGFVGAILGGGAAYAALAILAGHLPLDIAPGIAPMALISGFAIGVTMALIAALIPLAGLSRLKPLAILRGEVPRLDLHGGTVPILLIALAALVGLAMVEARSVLVGGIVGGGLIVGGIGVRLLAGLILGGLARLRPPWPALRLGLANLGRSDLRSATATTTLALAAALIAGPLVHRASLEGFLGSAGSGDMPQAFVIDLHPQDLDAFRATVAEHGGEAVGVSPIVTARYRGRAGETSDDSGTASTREGQRDRFFRNREQRLSWRAEPGPDERIVDGRWARPRDDGSGECTLDLDFAERLGVGIGDVLHMDVQGVGIDLHVVGLREVDFLGFKPNFFILVDEQILADAPATWIAAVRTSDPTGLQRRLGEALPTATTIDIAAIARRVATIVDAVLEAIAVVSAFAIAAGAMVLGSLAGASARERRADAAVLRALGCGDRRLRLLAGTEFAVQGLAAAILGIALGSGLVATVLWFGDLRPHLPLVDLAILAAGLAGLTLVVGLIAVRRTWRVSPLVVLRSVDE